MNNKISCPYCRREYDIPARWAGRKVLCKNCGNEFQVPHAPANPVSQAPDLPSLAHEGSAGGEFVAEVSMPPLDDLFEEIDDPLDQLVESPLGETQRLRPKPGNEIGIGYFLSRPLPCLIVLGVLLDLLALFFTPWELSNLTSVVDMAIGSMIAYVGFRADRGEKIKEQMCQIWILIYLGRALFHIGIMTANIFNPKIPSLAVEKIGYAPVIIINSLVILFIAWIVLFVMRRMFKKYGFVRPAGVWFLLVSTKPILFCIAIGMGAAAGTTGNDPSVNQVAATDRQSAPVVSESVPATNQVLPVARRQAATESQNAAVDNRGGLSDEDFVEQMDWSPFRVANANFEIEFPGRPKFMKLPSHASFSGLYQFSTREMVVMVLYVDRDRFKAKSDEGIFEKLVNDAKVIGKSTVLEKKSFLFDGIYPGVDMKIGNTSAV
jgi:hypothetical protein